MAFDTSRLELALEERKARLEQERQTLLQKTLALLDKIGPEYGIGKAYLFGSLVEPGHFSPESDVDIAVEQIDPDRFFEAISIFSTALHRQVDVVRLDTCHFAHRIREKGIVWETKH